MIKCEFFLPNSASNKRTVCSGLKGNLSLLRKIEIIIIKNNLGMFVKCHQECTGDLNSSVTHSTVRTKTSTADGGGTGPCQSIP